MIHNIANIRLTKANKKTFKFAQKNISNNKSNNILKKSITSLQNNSKPIDSFHSADNEKDIKFVGMIQTIDEYMKNILKI